MLAMYFLIESMIFLFLMINDTKARFIYTHSSISFLSDNSRMIKINKAQVDTGIWIFNTNTFEPY